MLVAVFWNPIIGSLIKVCLNSYCFHHFGTELQAEKIYKKDGYWVFEKPLLAPNGAQLSADRALFRIGIKPLQRTVDMGIIIENSKIDLREEGTNLEEVISDIAANTLPFWLFKIQTSFAIEEGKILWYEKDQDILRHCQADFRLLATSQESKIGSFAIFLDGKDNTSNFFEFQINKDKSNSINADLVFKNVALSKIACIYQALGHPFYGWEISNGIVDGKMHFHHPENRRPYLWGEAVLKEFSFRNTKLEIAGSILNADVNLETTIEEKGIPRIMGGIALGEETSITISKKEVPYWEMDSLKGNITFLPGEGINLAFGGKCRHQGHKFGININGGASIFDDTQAAIDLSCKLSTSNKQDGEIIIAMRQLGAKYNSAEVLVRDIGKNEFSLVQTVLQPYFPDIQKVQMLSGKLDAEGIAYMEGYRFTDFRIENMTGKNLHLDYDPLDLSFSVEEASGDLSIDLTQPDPMTSIDANFVLNNGKMDFLGVNGSIWKFEDIQSILSIRNGVLQKSEMKGISAGLKGSIGIDWESKEDFLKINFVGPARNLTNFLPVAFTKGIDKAFTHDAVNVIGGMAWGNSGSRFKGELRFSNSQTSSEDSVAFGFDLEKVSEKLWKRWPADQLAVSYWGSAGLEAMQKVMPPIASPMILFESNWIRAESGIAGLVVRKGWFRAENISLNRYVSPFIFSSNDQMNLEGVGNFKGVFDHKYVAIEYEANSILFENPYLAFQVDRIDSVKKRKDHANLYAAHYFDFEKGQHYGTIPLSHAQYLEKNSGLQFTDVDALVILEGDEIHFLDLTTQCEGVVFGGAIDLDFNIPNDRRFTLDIRANNLKGTVQQVNNVLKHFNPNSTFLNIPIDGQVSISDQEAWVSFIFEQGNFLFDANIQGLVSDASMAFENASTQITGMKFNFTYDHTKKTLDITNIQGDVLVGEGAQEEHYLLSGEYVRFVDFTRDLIEFDVWIGDQSRDIIRVVGKTLPEENTENSRLVKFHINHALTHMGDIHPANFQLIVKDWMLVDTFSLGMDLRLNTLLHDLHRFAKSGILPASKQIATTLNNIKSAYGELRMDLNYKGDTGEFTYRIKGGDIAISDYKFKNCIVQGRKCGEYWCLDTLQLDDLSISAYIKNKNEAWNFKQLRFNYGEAITMELDGDYVNKETGLNAHVALLEMNLEELKGGGPLIESFIARCNPHGRMKATGELKLNFIKGKPGWRAEAILDASLDTWDMVGLHFQDVQNVSCHFISDKGITFRNLGANIVTPDTRLTRAHIAFEKAYYEFLNGEIVFDHLEFQVGSHHLPWFANAMLHSFPGIVTPTIADVMKNCKLQGSFQGVMQYEYTPPYTAMQLKLNDGKYFFLNTEHDLRNFVMEYDPFEFKLTSKYLLGNDHVWLYARSTSPSLSHGELLLTDTPPGQNGGNSNQSLFVFWENDPRHGFSIKNTEGNFLGLTLHLQRDSSEPLSDKSMHLIGEVDINAEKATTLLSDDLAKKVIDWKIRDGYHLKGKWRLRKDADGRDYSNKLHFLGSLNGDHFALRGYQFDSMEAQVEYTPNSVRVRNLKVNDESGNLISEQINLVKSTNGHWHFSMPKMQIQRFKPSLLCEENSFRPQSRNPLMVRDVLVEGCQGSLSDSRSIIGKGTLRFLNKSRSRLQNTIFQIPSEILSRIGLDLSVLTPVTGSVDYTIQNGKIYLTKFKDIYSDRKLSKFYLSNAAPSSMDFEGNLNVQVRMKQNNLLFKLTELFTVNIGGDLSKPTYSFQKHNREEVVQIQ